MSLISDSLDYWGKGAFVFFSIAIGVTITAIIFAIPPFLDMVRRHL